MSIKITKTLLPFLFLAHTGFTSAATPGAYAGVGFGYSNLNDMQETRKLNDNNFGGRAFAGYNFNQILGLEGHFAQFGKERYQLNDIPEIKIGYDLSSYGLAAKLYAPIADKLNLYVSVGGAQMLGKLDIKYNNSTLLTDTANAVVLTAGVGGNFDITEHVTAGIGVTAYEGQDGDHNHNGIPASQMAVVNLAYKF